ncbi:MAG TPA: Coq4 family protein [Rhizomicrobium sp.]
MAGTPIDMKRRRDWKAAFGAMRRLIADPNDTVQVFLIMRALNADVVAKNYHRLLQTVEGGRIAYDRVELVTRLMDRAFLARFAPGTVGAAYRAFLERTGYSAAGLKDVGEEAHGRGSSDVAHPYAWFGRRERDIHDIWHVLTGYQADDPLGELCLVAFTYAQTGGFGWGFIALIGALKSLGEPNGRAIRGAVREGYAHGRAASWLHAEDYEALFAEPLDAARTRLIIAPPVRYRRAKDATATQFAHAVAAE